MAKKNISLNVGSSGGVNTPPQTPPKKTVAIVGSHPYTCDYAPWENKDIQIWGCNKHAMKMPRFDAHFQMHTKEIYLEKYGPEYVDFLKSEQNKPLYMRYPMDEFPDAVSYPLKEILELTADVLQGRDKGPAQTDLTPLQYFTSSINYMIAFAILEKYKKILVYGVEMSHRFDWYYQRENFAFWVGFAAGQGLDLDIHCANAIFRLPLYDSGYSQYQDETE